MLRPALILLIVAHLALPACQGRAEEVPPVTEPKSDCTLTVQPTSNDTLYEALRDAPDGAVICVEPGTWTGGHQAVRSVTLKASKPGTVILDAAGGGPVFGVPEDGLKVVLEGLVLKGGSFGSGGAIPLETRSDVTLRRCTLTGNQAGEYGGGALYARRGKFTLVDCRFEGNQGGFGGGLLADGVSDWEIQGGAITGNKGERGGALAVRDGARVVMTGVAIKDNQASEGGGAAIWVDGTSTRGPELSIHGGELLGGTPPIHQADDTATIERD